MGQRQLADIAGILSALACPVTEARPEAVARHVNMPEAVQQVADGVGMHNASLALTREKVRAVLDAR
ncbi:hypothetical protein D3C81_2183940 [compost metagenome]